jgi:hypothetical protein
MTDLVLQAVQQPQVPSTSGGPSGSGDAMRESVPPDPRVLLALPTLVSTSSAPRPGAGATAAPSLLSFKRRSERIATHVEFLQSRANQFLTDSGMTLSQAGRTRFLAALVREFLAVTALLERRARGDCGPDQHLDWLAPSLSLTGQPSEAVIGRTSQTQRPSAVALFEAYIKDKPSLAASTIAGWRCVFTALDALPPEEAVVDQRRRSSQRRDALGHQTGERGLEIVR